MADRTMGAAERAAGEVVTMLRARESLIWIVTPEEKRVRNALIEAAGSVKMQPWIWSCARGIRDVKGTAMPLANAEPNDPEGVLSAVQQAGARDAPRTLWILNDFPAWLGSPTTRRKLRDLAIELPTTETIRTIVIVSTSVEVPPDLRDLARVIEWPLPDRVDLERIFATLPEKVQAACNNGSRAAAIDAALGLTAEGASSAFARSLVQHGRIDPPTIAAEKRRVIGSSRGLTWYEPDPRGLAAVGGLDKLKKWLTTRQSAFSPAARAFGLQAPRGLLIAGLPGSGKSLTAKAVAAAWGVPLLRLDLGGSRSKYVGESESNIREALKLADTVGRCVLWLDEIEKALAGSTPGAAADGGVASDALGTLLSWMQDRTSDVFIVATANDVRGLPPELLRKGRFDEIFWTDLPTPSERAEILRVTLKQFGRSLTDDEVPRVVAATDGFGGSEIAALVPAALFVTFADGQRALTADDLIAEAGQCVPLATTAADKVAALREWAKTRARRASSEESAPTAADNRWNLA